MLSSLATHYKVFTVISGMRFGPGCRKRRAVKQVVPQTLIFDAINHA